jgi:glycine/D-amino acid oxidase-like deaminating enzyme
MAGRWGGPIALSTSKLPLAGALRLPGQFACVCFNGVGLAAGFYYGHLVAHRMAGLPHPDLGFLEPPLRAGWIPPQPLRSLGVGLFLRAGIALQAWREGRRGGGS